MSKLKDFDIYVLKLSNSEHEFEFEIGDSFFQLFENALLEKGSLNAKVTVDKTDARLEFDFNIEGNVELICDRSLEPFGYPITSENTIIFKYSDKHAELSEDVYQIPHGEHKINVAQFIYEFISLNIPMRKIHPKFESDEEEEDEDGTIIYTSGNAEEETQEDEIDPRWNELNKLIDKNGTS